MALNNRARKTTDPFAALAKRRVPTVAWLDAEGKLHTAPPDSRLQASEIAEARRARRGPKYQHRRHYEGYYWCAGTKSLVWYESMTEYAALMALDFGRGIRRVVSQPLCLILPDGSPHVPDYFVIDEAGTAVLVDVRPESLQEKSKAQFAATARMCEQIGWEYLLLGELDPVVRGNLECIAGWRHPRYAAPAELSADVIAFAATGRPFGQIAGRLAGTVPGRGIHHLYHLLWCRQLRFDLMEPLADTTKVWAA